MRAAAGDPDLQPEMPDPGPAAYLLGYLFEAGPVMNGGMGQAPVSHQELEAWSRLTGIRLSPWEARTLRQLSRDYCAQQGLAEDPKCPAPWRAPGAAEKVLVAHDLRSAISGLTSL